MATREHIELVREGADAVTGWRMMHPEETLDLENADLRGVRLPEMLFLGANLKAAELSDADLTGAAFLGSNLDGAELFRAKLMNAELHGASMRNADLRHANLSDADLNGADLTGANLEKANLSRTNLSGVNFTGANLSGANLSEANMFRANITGSKLCAARLENTFVGEIVYDVQNWTCAGIHASSCYGNPFFKRDVEDEDWLEHFKVQKPRLFRVWKATSDCGRSLSRVVSISGVIALLFGCIYAQSSVPLIEVTGTEDSWFAPFYYSIVTFTTLGFGDITPSTLLGQFVVVIEVLLGYLALGILVSILANKVARRA